VRLPGVHFESGFLARNNLCEHACDEMQGFLFSRPVTAQQMTVLLRSPPRLASPPLQPDADGSPDAIADELKDAGA
jgi:hypothetical protein